MTGLFSQSSYLFCLLSIVYCSEVACLLPALSLFIYQPSYDFMGCAAALIIIPRSRHWLRLPSTAIFYLKIYCCDDITALSHVLDL